MICNGKFVYLLAQRRKDLIIDLSDEYISLHIFKGFDERCARIFSPENSTIASGEVNTILFITVRAFQLTPYAHSIADDRRNTVFSPLNIPFESEQKQKFQRKYSLSLDNFSVSSLQLVPNYILYPCICPDVHL